MAFDATLRQEIVNFLSELDTFHSDPGRKAILPYCTRADMTTAARMLDKATRPLTIATTHAPTAETPLETADRKQRAYTKKRIPSERQFRGYEDKRVESSGLNTGTPEAQGRRPA